MNPHAPRRRQPQGVRERFAALRNVPPFLRLVWLTSPGLTLALVALRLARALMPVTALWIAKLIIDEVVRLTALPGAPETLDAWRASGELAPVLWLIAAEFALAIASDVANRLVRLCDSLLQERLVIDLSTRMMDHAATLDLADFEDSGFQDRLDRARRQTMGRIPLLSQVMTQAQDLVTVLSFGAGLMLYNPWLVVLLIVALVPAFLGEAHFNAELYRMNWRRTPETRERDYLRMIAASADTAKEVKLFGLAPFLRDRYIALSRRFLAENREIQKRQTGWLGLLTAIGTAGYYIAYLWIVVRTLTGALTIGDLTFLSGSFLRLRALIEGLLTGFSTTTSQAMYLDDLFDFLAARPRLPLPANPVPVPQPIRRGFRFEGVGFRYPGSDRWAVRHLSFEIRAGETLALVGENGAGKTTIVKLLTRLYDPDEGRITLDGTDLRDFDPDALRAQIGVIFQDFVRYSMTAGDNIAVGRIEAREDAGRVARAARAGMAEGVIAKLPEGYGQMIGKRFWHGVELSGGEWQKIAIARAYMRDSQVLILDEPTAALDARAEVEVFDRFNELSAGRTAVLISHRFSSVRMADRIVVLADGRVEDEGTHEALAARPGRYRELFELQAAGYR
ncbi:ATP-binding cassette domain-containing protein [Paracoccus sp. S-4012]|uniref:ABC transporter ATP-binding protein n=1 Tax=Paracoccus sp. S-4012 TaxID=2665648 RepID=UPI0012B15F27|nr:ABC transporter ATP-binding protein [Paracoccus sp. S-4012]MRX51610.1 ATP-binding cassette domain-containing protein [Paracoccus sp. S-4012]